MLASFAHAKITKGDTLVIEIRGVPQEEQAQINGNYQVSTNGTIHLPYLSNQPVNVYGLTTASVARKIESAYKNAQIYTTPAISIRSMEEMRAREKEKEQVNTQTIQKFVTISGQVGRPGPQQYRPGMRLIDVVSAAGPTTFAAQNRVELLRNGKIYKYNMKVPAHMIEKVYPNDQVTLKEKNWRGQ